MYSRRACGCSSEGAVREHSSRKVQQGQVEDGGRDARSYKGMLLEGGKGGRVEEREETEG